MKVAEFDYELPQEMIAQNPVEPRDHARLMVININTSKIMHYHFDDLLKFLNPNDVLVVNESRVIPARLHGTVIGTKAKIELLLLRPLTDGKWEVLVKPGKRAKIGAKISFGDRLQAVVIAQTDFGGKIVKFQFEGSFDDILEELGETPLPPYITAKLEDKERYQTVYANEKGSVAAPTAGLHFTNHLIEQIKAVGVEFIPLILHVGLATFRPVKVENVEEHQMHSEFYSLTEEHAKMINCCRSNGGRVIAVGTTVVRVLETLAQPNGEIRAGSGWTDIFIYPGFKFSVVDGLLTNFHLPKSSLLMLVSAFAGYDLIKLAYQVAIAENYRFFSFGDAMLLLNSKEQN